MTTISEKEYATAWKAEHRAWKKETAATEGVLYVRSGLRRPPGWVLAHNHILHGKNTRNGVNGFRYFWVEDPKRDGFLVCRCGWRPDWGKHYSAYPNVKILKRVSQAEKWEP